MNTKRQSWLLSLAMSLALPGLVAAQTLSHDRHPRAGSRPGGPHGGSCGPTEITQSASQNIVGGNSIACADQSTGFTYENHYWRAFDGAELVGVDRPLSIQWTPQWVDDTTQEGISHRYLDDTGPR